MAVIPIPPFRGILDKYLYREGSPRGPTLYPFICHFKRNFSDFFVNLLLPIAIFSEKDPCKASLRGRRSSGKRKGIWARDRTPRALARPIPLSPSSFNAV